MKIGKLDKKVVATDIFGSYVSQNQSIWQSFDSCFDSLAIPISTFTDHFRQVQCAATNRLTLRPYCLNFDYIQLFI